MSGIKELVGPFVELCNKYLGITIDPFWAEIAVALSILVVVGLALKNFVLWTRRRFGDASALPEDQLAMVNLIARDLQGIRDFISQNQTTLDANLSAKFKQALLEIKESDNDNPNPMEEQGEARKARLMIATRISEAVFEKFLSGGWFFEQPERHTFECVRFLASEERIQLKLQTPYRVARPDNQLAYILEIWVDGPKVLNFEWDYSGNARLRYMRTGNWVDEVLSWRLFENTTSERTRRRAAG